MNILVIHTGGIGDLILALPALGALRRKLPDARMTILGHPSRAAIAVSSGYAHAVRSIDSCGFHSLYSEETVVPEALADYLRRFDLIIAWLSDPAGTITAKLERMGAKSVTVANPFPPQADRIHASQYLLNTLSDLGVTSPLELPRLKPSAEDKHWAEQFFGKTEVGAFRLAIHPGSGGTRKRWPAERFAAVARWAVERLNAEIILLFGEAEESVRSEIFAQFEGISNLKVVQEELGRVLALLSVSDAYLGNDSGISHMSAGAGIPTVALFGPTEPAVWAPRGRRVQIVRSKGMCEGCSREGAVTACMHSLDVEEVKGALEKILAQKQKRNQIV